MRLLRGKSAGQFNTILTGLFPDQSRTVSAGLSFSTVFFPTKTLSSSLLHLWVSLRENSLLIHLFAQRWRPRDVSPWPNHDP